MKIRHLVLLTAIAWNVGWADFSDASIQLHPFYPFDGPFVIEINGVWPTDCHPGEQTPVIQSYDGDSVLIEFEINVVHVTCNQNPTPYRVLVDMSDVVGTLAGSFPTLAIVVRFGDAELDKTVMLDCGPVVPCQIPPVEDVKPESGFFGNAALEDQGLILVRQNQRMAAYPLTYDIKGGSEWLFAGGEILQDVYFAPLYQLSGGQCLGCPLPSQPPQMEEIGKLTLLMDSESLIQVKINDGLFSTYRSIVFGYNELRLGPAGNQILIDLAGRWGISENHGTMPPLGDLTEFFPGAFDILTKGEGFAGEQAPPDGQVHYEVKTLTGVTLGELVCRGQADPTDAAQVCEYAEPGDAAEPLFLFYQDGPSSLTIQFARPVIAVGVPPGGRAIRLD